MKEIWRSISRSIKQTGILVIFFGSTIPIGRTPEQAGGAVLVSATVRGVVCRGGIAKRLESGIGRARGNHRHGFLVAKVDGLYREHSVASMHHPIPRVEGSMDMRASVN